MTSSFYIRNAKGQGLHYINGNLYWRYPYNVENIVNFTPFNTPNEARKFISERNIPGTLSVGQINYQIQIVQENEE